MYKDATGTVIAVKRQWWLKVNTKPIRKHAMDGAIFPHIIKVEYSVDGKAYTKSKWISAGRLVPIVGDPIWMLYHEKNPKKAKIFL